MAGVVVAFAVGFGLLVIALVMWWLRRRKASRAAQRLLSHSPTYEKASQVAVATEEIGNDGARYELDSASQRVTELPRCWERWPSRARSIEYGKSTYWEAAVVTFSDRRFWSFRPSRPNHFHRFSSA